jgi:hypothetical protein
MEVVVAWLETLFQYNYTEINQDSCQSEQRSVSWYELRAFRIKLSSANWSRHRRSTDVSKKLGAT